MDSRLGAVFAAINVSSTTGPQAVCPSSFAQSSAANQIGTVQAGISQIGLSAPFPQTQFNSGAISPPELPFFTQPFQNGLLDPSQFNLANLPTETLQNLNKLVSQPVENLRSSPILTYLRGAVVQALSQSSSGSETSTPDEPPSLEMPSILPSTSEPALPEPNPEVPRRIRRRRPKSPKRSKSPKQKTAEEEEQQMNTPDDPVIHSPSSSRAMFGTNPLLMSSPMGDTQDNSEESRRRQKTCRVCGDHATGYNFNVITCESCKAFFRRNALRPKEFKCPYSDDCEINAVSRRFCQKCRLRKCFAVGMKKEWILNDEQLRRRKNSRLNSMKGMGGGQAYGIGQQLIHSPQPGMLMNRSPDLMGQVKSELPDQPQSSFNTLCNYDLQQLFQSANQTNSPGASTFSSPALMQRRQSDLALSPLSQGHASINSLLSPQNVASPESPVALLGANPMDLGKHVDIQNLMKQSFSNPENYSRLLQGDPKLAQSSVAQVFTTSAFKPETSLTLPAVPTSFSTDVATSGAYSMNGAHGAGEAAAGQYDQYKMFFSKETGKISPSKFFPFLDMSPDGYHKMGETIHDELHNAHEDLTTSGPGHVDVLNHADHANDFQLNSSELCELDVVRNAYSCMDEPLADTKSKAYLTKKGHKPNDIMNIMDISMRRFVRMTKKLPSFNTLSSDTKLHLLKAAMVNLLTLRGATRFDVQKLCFSTKVAGHVVDISLDMFDQLNDKNQKMKFIKFCLSMDPNLRHNDTIINLMGLVILFRNTNVVMNEAEKQLTKKYHTLYSNLLRRYVESIHAHECMPIIESIPKTLDCLRDISSSAETLFAGKVNPDEIEQLPTEFFRTEPLPSTSQQPAESSTASADAKPAEPGSSMGQPDA